MLNKDDIINAVAGMWPEAIQAISSVDARYFTGKHTDCPICQDGKDRFRFDDCNPDTGRRDGCGGYICSQCGSGSGLKLLMGVSGMNFGEALHSLNNWMGGVPASKRDAVRAEVSQKSQHEKYGAYADHERCSGFLSTCQQESVKYDCLSAGISPDEVMTRQSSSGDKLVCVPVSICSSRDMLCDVAFIRFGDYPAERDVKFLSGGFPASGVSVIKGEGEYTYLCADWVEAWHTHHSTGAEVWCCWSASNLAQVAYRMKTRKLRVSCRADDKETLYAADEANLQVITPRDNKWPMGIPKVLHKAEVLCSRL